jgi:hypothetical protein
MQGIISMGGLIAYLVASIEKMKDPRQPSPNTTYSLKDAVLGGFSLFLMQCESFLEHQRQLHSRNGRDNLQTHIPYLATRILINTNKSRLAEVLPHKGFRNHNLLINKSTPLYAAQKH